MSQNVSVPTTKLIGSLHRRTFLPLRRWLSRHTQIVAAAETLTEALQTDAKPKPTDFTIVLQSWPDQFAETDIQQLVGHTLFRRLFCCYSAACESDGRNRSGWPDVARVPQRLAQSIIEQEIYRWRSGQPAPPPTLARDEVFAHRLPTNSSDGAADLHEHSDFHDLTIAVLSPDRVLRNTIAATLRDLNADCVSLPLLQDERSTISRTPALQQLRSPVQLVLHDLDPFGPRIEASLQQAKESFPAALIWGLATMPDAGLATEIEDLQLPVVIPKLDLHHGLLYQLRQLQLATAD